MRLGWVRQGDANACAGERCDADAAAHRATVRQRWLSASALACRVSEGIPLAPVGVGASVEFLLNENAEVLADAPGGTGGDFGKVPQSGLQLSHSGEVAGDHQPVALL